MNPTHSNSPIEASLPSSPSLLEVFQHVFQQLQKTSQMNLAQLASTEQQSHWNKMEKIVQETSPSQYRQRLMNEFFYLGPIHPLIQDTEISEIIVNGQFHIVYEKQGVLREWDDCFLSELTFSNFIHRICEETKMILTLNQLFVDGNWSGWRVHLTRNPVVHVDFHLSLRRHPKNPWTFLQLKNQQWAPDRAIDLIQKLIQKRSNMLICGPTSSGKTSVLNACLQCLDSNERVITIEDSDELLLPNNVSTKLLTRLAAQGNLVHIEQTELVKQSLRMRPDRIIMGETRGKEAKDLLMALATGHTGSLGTIHAKDHKQALWRLEMLIQMGAPSWKTETIRQMIAFGIDHLIILDRVPINEDCTDSSSPTQRGIRKLMGIYKLSGVENTGFLFEALFQRKILPQGSLIS